MDIKFWQSEIKRFVLRTWGKKSMYNLPERALRIVEETIELAQAHGVQPSKLYAVIDRVYSRPLGNATEEVGDIAFTLLAYTEVSGDDLEGILSQRLQRVESIPVEDLRERHRQKRAAGTLLYED